MEREGEMETERDFLPLHFLSIYGICRECCKNLKHFKEMILDKKSLQGSFITGVGLLSVYHISSLCRVAKCQCSDISVHMENWLILIYGS